MLQANDRDRSRAKGAGADLGAIVLGCVEALAMADADRLEQMAARCSEMSVELQWEGFAGLPDARLMAGLSKLNRVLHRTRANIDVLERLRHADTEPLEYVSPVQSSREMRT